MSNGDALGARDAYGQAPLDRARDWKMEAIQHEQAHVIALKYEPNPPSTPARYSGYVGITPGVTGQLSYVPATESGSSYRGRFTVTTSPPSTTRTLSNLFAGKTVQSLILRLGGNLAAAAAAAPIPIAVERDPSINSRLVMRATTPLTVDPTALAGRDVVAIINFAFTAQVPGTGTAARWTHNSNFDVLPHPRAAWPTNAKVSGIAWDGDALWVLLAHSAGATRQVVVLSGWGSTAPRNFAKGIPRTELDAAFPPTHPRTLPGITYNGRSIVIRGADGGAKAFTLEGARYPLDDLPAGTFIGVATYGLDWDGTNYLYYEIDLKGSLQHVPSSDSKMFVRYLTRAGVRDMSKDIDVSALPGALLGVLAQVRDVAKDARGTIFLIRDRGGIYQVSSGALSEVVAHNDWPGHKTENRQEGITVDRAGDVLFAAAKTPNQVIGWTPDMLTDADHETAWAESEYDFRTVDQAELQELAREQHVRAIQPAGPTLTIEQVAPDGNVTNMTWHTGEPPSAAAFPAAPTTGMRIKLLNRQTLPGFGVLRAGQSNDQTGWLSGEPDIGSLPGAPRNGVKGLVSFGTAYSGAGQAQMRDKTIWIRAAGETRTPAAVTINGTRHTVTNLGAPYPDHWVLASADAGTLEADAAYKVQFEYADGSKDYADVTYQPDDWSFDGYFWVRTPAAKLLPRDLTLPAGAVPAANRVVTVDPGNNAFKLSRGLTKLHDGQLVELPITDINAAARTASTPFAPAFDLDDYAAGMVTAEVELTRGASSGPGLGVGAGAAFRGVGLASTGALGRLAVYAPGTSPLPGIELASVGVFVGTAERGDVGVYLVRDATNGVRCVIDYKPGAGTAAGNLTVTARMTLGYQPFL